MEAKKIKKYIKLMSNYKSDARLMKSVYRKNRKTKRGKVSDKPPIVQYRIMGETLS